MLATLNPPSCYVSAPTKVFITVIARHSLSAFTHIHPRIYVDPVPARMREQLRMHVTMNGWQLIEFVTDCF